MDHNRQQLPGKGDKVLKKPTSWIAAAALCKALDTCISVYTAVGAIASGVGTSTKILSWKQSPWNNFLLAP